MHFVLTLHFYLHSDLDMKEIDFQDKPVDLCEPRYVESVRIEIQISD